MAMNDEVVERVINDMSKRLDALENWQKEAEKRMAGMDERFAVINTKLSAILWGLGVIGAALLGNLVKGWLA